MGSRLKVLLMTRDTPGFYEGMGPLFGSRAVAKEVGINMYDDEDKRWFVAFEGRSFVGCASVRGAVVSDCYVTPEKRRQGAFTEILAHIMEHTPGNLRAACTPASLKAFKAAGFRAVRNTKNFTFVEARRA